MPIPKKKVVKKEDYIEKNHSTNITDDEFLDLSIPLDDDEDLDLIRKHKTENNDTTLKKDEDIVLDLSLDEDDNIELVRQHQTKHDNATLKNSIDDNSDLSSDEDSNFISRTQAENKITQPENSSDFKWKKDCQPTEKPVPKIKLPEFDFCGYTLYSLADDEFSLLKKLKLNDEILSNYCLAKISFLEYMQGYKEDLKFKKHWGFPFSGNYIGYILNCEPSAFNDIEYYVEFLANSMDVCLFKFSTSFRDTVNNCVKRELGWTNNIFKQCDYTALKGFLVYISVENVRLENGKIFSNIINLKILDSDTEKVLDKTISDMSN